jgi:hypothetical protein
MKTLIAVCLTLSLAVACSAQPRPDILWTRNYGGAETDVATCIRPTLDGNYIVAGTTQSFGADDIYLIKINPQGDTLWTRVLDFGNIEQGNSLWPTADGGFLIAGSIFYMDMGNQALLLVRTNDQGDTLWTRAYSAGWTNYATVIKPTPDGGYVVAGAASTVIGDNDLYLLKINAFGDTLWTRTFGTDRNDEVYDVTQTADGGYIVGGNSWMQNTNASSYVVKTDALGYPQWTRNYGVYVILVAFVQQTADGGYMLAGSGVPTGTQHLGGFLMKTDSAGNALWTQMHSENPLDELIVAAQATSDGGCVLAGSLANLDSALIGMQITRMDSAGTVLWYRTYEAGTQAEALSIIEAPDHSYIVAGRAETEMNGTDFNILRTGPESIVLMSPAGGASLAIGRDVDVRWNGAIRGGNVVLELNRNYPSATWETIAASAVNNGHYSWSVTGPESDHARLRILHLTMADLSDTSATDLRLRIPGIRLVWPNGGETVLSGVRDTVRFERIVVSDVLRLQINRNYPNGSWEAVGGNVDGDSTGMWIVQLPGGTHCRLRIVSVADSTLADISDGDFTLRAPQITLMAPNGGEQVAVGVPFNVTWSAPEHNGNLRISLNRNYPTGNWETINQNARNVGHFAWTPSPPAGEHCRVRIAALLDAQSYSESAADFAIASASVGNSMTDLPIAFALEPAYPNPFNARTTLSFAVPQPGDVVLTIHDLTGRLVQTIAQGNVERGRYRILFDAATLTSGLYFVKMQATHFSAVQKLILLK